MKNEVQELKQQNNQNQIIDEPSKDKDRTLVKELLEILMRNMMICNLDHVNIEKDYNLEQILQEDDSVIIEKFTQLMFILIDELLRQLEDSKRQAANNNFPEEPKG